VFPNIYVGKKGQLIETKGASHDNEPSLASLPPVGGTWEGDPSYGRSAVYHPYCDRFVTQQTRLVASVGYVTAYESL